MKLYRWFEGRYLHDKTLHGKLTYIFFFFFIIPISAFIYFGFRYKILTDRYVPVFFIGMLAFSFLGLNLLRKVFDDISSFSSNISSRVDEKYPGEKIQAQENELARLVRSFP